MTPTKAFRSRQAVITWRALSKWQSLAGSGSVGVSGPNLAELSALLGQMGAYLAPLLTALVKFRSPISSSVTL